jgi:hypothetical protein
MAAFERLPHYVDIADAFEAVIGTPARQLDDMGDEIARDGARIDEIGEPERARKRLARGVDVDAASTSTSPGFGPSTSTVSITSGSPGANAIAARVFMPRFRGRTRIFAAATGSI